MKSKLCMLFSCLLVSSSVNVNQVNSIEKFNLENNKKEVAVEIVKVETKKEEIVYDGLTKKELINKISRSLNDDLKDKASLYVNYSLKKGVDPYLAVAISLHETGCKWKCSTLVKKCNNVGGMVGSHKCGNTPYNTFDTLDDGIKSFIDNLSNNYIKKGLNTPELMNKKYAASKTWAKQVNKYINEIKKA